MAFRSSGDVIADRRFDYARAFAAEGDHAAAADLFAQTLELVPGYVPAWVALGAARAAAGDRDGAVDAFRRALSLDPADELAAALQLAALGAAPAPAAPPAAYVRGLFDDYAPRFEKALVDGLRYRTPGALADLLRTTDPGRRWTRALDLGCGTGLLGAAIRADCDGLDGVDLSAGMIAEARAKGLYDRLDVADIVAHLRGTPDRFDLIAAADVFVYLGDLRPALAAAADRLAPGGRIAFSVESHPGPGFVLRASLRYAHGRPHVEAAAAEAGLSLLAVVPSVLREDAGLPVEGLLVICT